ncbi:MAG: hypothetical protein COA58_06840 [Bacteroidetes bacterium]|nr:MAG: hypothetical protein COA58_06840 [Bacteroidota bacterium]
MKKYILSIAILFVLLFASAIFLPYLFKDRIIESVKTETNKNLNASLDFSPDIGINIFKSFPNLNLSFKELSLISKDTTFQNDTFFAAKKLEVSFDLMKFYKEQKYIFKSITIQEPLLHLEMTNDSTFNWDLVKKTSEESKNDETLNFELEAVNITNGTFDYLDNQSNVDIQLKGLNHSSSGNFNTDHFSLASKTFISEALIISDDVAYLNNWSIEQNGTIEVDLTNGKYAFPKNNLTINGLGAFLDGFIQLQEDDIIFNLAMNSKSPDLNEFLTLIPAIYTSDFSSMETKGTGNLSATFKGIFNDISFPAYDLKLGITQGWFKYPDLPLPAEDINLDLHVYSLDGNIDKTVIDIPKMHFKIANDPFDVKLNMQDIFSDALVEVEAKGKIDLANVSRIVPLPDTELTGNLASDFKVKGRANDISNSAIDKFTASGTLETDNLVYKTTDMNEKLVVSNAQIILKNQRVTIPEFKGILGSNDVDFSGEFDNFFGYILGDQTLEGRATLTSNMFNANDFTSEDADESEQTKMTLIEVPGNVSIDLTTAIKKLKYDDLVLTDFAGKIGIKNRILTLNDISTELLGGRVNLTGLYEYNTQKPFANFDITYSDIKIADLLSKFKVIKAFAPIAAQVNAMTTAKFSFSTVLNNDMSPKLENMNLGGSLNLENIIVDKLEVLKGIDSKLGTNHFNVNKLRDFLVKFNIKDGKLLVSPFDLFIDSSKLTLNGLSKLDGSIDYSGFLSIPSSYVKNETTLANNLTKGTAFSNLQLSPKDFLDVAIRIGGTFKKPEIKLNLKEIKKSLKQSLTNSVISEVDKKKEEAKNTATNELNKIKEETQRKADEAKENLQKELEQKKKEAAERLRQEAEDKKKKLKDEAANKLKGLFKK